MTTGFHGTLRSRISLALGAAILCLAFRPIDAPPGILILHLVNPLPTDICFGESASIDFFVVDMLNGIPLGATVHLASDPIAPAEALVTGSPQSLTFKPLNTGDFDVQLVAQPLVGAMAMIPFRVHVDPCKWEWKLKYSGSYPNPEGYWTFFEEASVDDGTMDLTGSEGDFKLEGRGTVTFAADMNGADEHSTCTSSRKMEGSGKVKISGSYSERLSGQIVLKFEFDPIELPGGTTFTCQLFGAKVPIPFPSSSATVNLNALALNPGFADLINTRKSIPVAEALVWQLPGEGTVEIAIRRKDPRE